MEQRKLQIKATIDEAEEKRLASEAELEKYRQQNIKFEEEKEAIFLKTRQEAEKEREKLREKLAREMEATKAKWYQDIAQEREEFLVNVRRRTLEEIYRVLRLSLADLANSNLENQIINVFLERLQKESLNWEQISTQEITIMTAFSLNNFQKETITKTIEQYTEKNIQIIFEICPDLICGISLTVNDQEIVWSLENYLQNLSENLTTVINN